MGKLKIIIVENDEDEQFFMKEGFVASGLFEILALARSGNELFDWLKQNDQLPDLILSDLNMPGKNGYDIIEEISNREEYRQIPVVITSTSSAEKIREKCLDMGAADYIVKPETFIEYERFAENLYKLHYEKA